MWFGDKGTEQKGVFDAMKLFEQDIAMNWISNEYKYLKHSKVLRLERNIKQNPFNPDQVHFLVLESSAGAIRVHIGPPQEASIFSCIGLPQEAPLQVRIASRGNAGSYCTSSLRSPQEAPIQENTG